MRRSAGRRSGIAAAVLCGALVLTACGGADDDAAGKVVGGATPTAGQTPGGGAASGTPSATADAEPTATATPKAKPSTKPTDAPGSSAGGTGGAKPTKAPKPAGTPDCDHKMPISPDEIAVERYTPEGGALNLIVHLGNWGCPEPGEEGVAFAPMGREIDMPLDQAAYVTAVNPIVESTENQRIGVQELLDWLEAHPDAGLVFKYHLGKDGAIDRLEQEYTP